MKNLNKCPKCGHDLTEAEELEKKIKGTWTIKEIIEAMNRILDKAQ